MSIQNTEELVTRLQKLGVSENKAKESVANKKLRKNVELILDGVQVEVDKPTGTLLFSLASQITPKAAPHAKFISDAIIRGDIQSTAQLSAGIKFAETHSSDVSLNCAEFKKACGIGVTVSRDDIVKYVSCLLQGLGSELTEKRYSLLGAILGKTRAGQGVENAPEDVKSFANERLKWANPAIVKEVVDEQMLTLLGPKDERDAPKKVPKAKKEAKQALTKKDSEPEINIADEKVVADLLDRMFYEGEMAKLHKPGGNPQIDPALMEQHLKETRGQVLTRFPPEPNGLLHIGHAKAINVDFGYARVHKGSCCLRYDDTNPEAEEERYFTSILENVQWLGFEPSRVTHSSDYFQRLYDVAVDLIKRDLAYVDHSTGAEIKEQRGGENRGPRFDSPYRNRPVKESLREFERMKNGEYEEGEAVLRMKMDMQNGNPQFWDLVAYRVLKAAHHRTGTKWVIYPTYDFTHCLVDSFENITHSLCTLEFRLSRESYYWLCDAARVYKPVQFEFGRLSITNTVLSKRKLLKLVNQGLVRNWDDPRLYTLVGLRRRGFPPQAINAFVRELGVTTSNSTIRASRLENKVREYLNETTDRVMAVMDPLPVIISNLPEDYEEILEIPNHPRIPSKGKHKTIFSSKIYIDREDFRPEGSKDYYRLAPGKNLGLLQVPYPIRYESHTTDHDGHVVAVRCRYENDLEKFSKPKTYVQWLSQRHCMNIEARMYNSLFLHENPNEVQPDFLADINPDSLQIKEQAKVEANFANYAQKALEAIEAGGLKYVRTKVEKEMATDAELKCVEELKFQFLRIGYFVVDPLSDLENGKIVASKIVGLKEDKGKQN